jgi:hypothetical protein
MPAGTFCGSKTEKRNAGKVACTAAYSWLSEGMSGTSSLRRFEKQWLGSDLIVVVAVYLRRCPLQSSVASESMGFMISKSASQWMRAT